MSHTDVIGIVIQGECDPRFTAVREALERNFAERGEIGSAVAVYYRGEKVVDLWGGHLDAARTRPWRADTLCLMYSIAKSMCALCVHILADRGQVDLEAPVAAYWPEFAQNGKDAIRVRHILSHNCGVCFADAAAPGDIFNDDNMRRALAVQAPAWPVESKGAYNTVNIGHLAGEVVRRITGQRIQDFLQENVCRPLGAQYFLGVAEHDLARCADLTPNPGGSTLAQAASNPDSPVARAWRPMPKGFGVAVQNSTVFRRAGVPSFGGFGEARAMARIYAALANGGEIDGVRLLSPEAVARATTLQWREEADGMTGRPIRMAMGFWKNTPVHAPMGPNPNAFGHPGSGGARALADPDRNLALCYVTNYQCERRSVGERPEAIVEAAFAGID